ncbi:carboxymuconolactone decarboxylase family protein [Fulvivirga ligni]|uniref:carboxymuconolactone decarboxylase family protein n=1 Tax=Fulvivirga ligni TaxID=2904246 RepID=UPI001F3DDF5F|nr:carboxymuconolactone decarboxylase family protein [Fulvivirga ligni]UII19024.1 carboxymuconolactone decarboxylase family protein [Fulvivirga ligni]
MLKIFTGLMIFLAPSLQGQKLIDKSSGLSPQQQSIVRISSLAAQGDLEGLRSALDEGLNNGLTINEIKEVLVHIYAYCGFPRSIRGLQTFMMVLEVRKQNGVQDEWGKEASPIVDTRDRYQRGLETLEELLKAKLDGSKPGYQQFSPEIDVFLKEHLFADIFERDVLTFKQRELTTISVIAALGDLEPMLKSHMKICLKTGLTASELEDYIITIKKIIGNKKTKVAKKILKEVLSDEM